MKTVTKAMATTLACAVILGGGTALPPAHAANVLAIRDMPIRNMTDEDRDLLSASAKMALDQAKEGEVITWDNPKTAAHGELIPRASFLRDGRTCRKLEVANTAGGASNRLVLTLCRQDDGEWKVEAP